MNPTPLSNTLEPSPSKRWRRHWSEAEYLAMDSSQLIELTDECLESLPVPDEMHQGLVLYFHRLISRWLSDRRGVVWVSPFRVRVGEGKFREPDLCLLFDPSDRRRGRRFWTGADVVFEIVSPDNPDRDYITKRADYAAGGIEEYWIVDALRRKISVLTLSGGIYRELGVCEPGQQATGRMMHGFQVDVAACFTQADRAVSSGG